MDTAYIKDIFQPDDRLAVFLKAGERIEQHFASAAELCEPQFQAWLREQNDAGANVYVGMNALKPSAQNRTKDDVAEIRNIYLDIDHDADNALERIKTNTPTPNWILNTSPGKCQVVWKVTGFSAAEAEALQKSMCLKYGADRAATDVSRVFRIPGFDNYKYEEPYRVTAERFSDSTHAPEDFNIAEILREQSPFALRKSSATRESKNVSETQSHRDWFVVCRRLEKGENPADVKQWLESSRQDKPDPRYYAELTVNKAVAYVAEKATENTFNDLIKSNTKKENSDMPDEQQRHYIEGNGFAVRDELKALGCRFDPDKKQWYAADAEKAKEAKSVMEIETSAMNNAKEHEVREPRHYIEGNSFAVKDKLKEMGCMYDADERKWFHTDPEIAKEAQALVPKEIKKYPIGDAPREMTDELKGMGCKWNKEIGWYHNDQETAERARERIQEVEPRHYLEGDGYAVKDRLKAMGCKWDGVKKQWYTTDISKAAEAQALIDNAPEKERKKAIEKHYLTGETLALKDQLKEMGCKWDAVKKQWYHTDPAVARKAQALIDSNSGFGKEKTPKPGDPANSPKTGGDTISRVAKEFERGM